MSDLFAVLADPTRRRIVEALHGGESTVGGLVDVVDIHQPGVSRHLRILHDAGVVSMRADGQKRLYALKPDPFAELEAWIHTYARTAAGRMHRLGELAERERKVKP